MADVAEDLIDQPTLTDVVDPTNTAVGRVHRAVAELFSALDDLDTVLDGGAGAASIEQVVIERSTVVEQAVADIWETRSLLDAAMVALIDPWDAWRLWSSDGSRNAAARLVSETKCSPSLGREVIRRSRSLRFMPLTHETFMKGLITTSMVDLLSSARQRVNKTAFARAEEMLVSWCRDLGYHEVKRALDYWVAEQSRERDERRHEEMYRERRLNLFPDHDEMLQIHGQLDKVNGAIVADELERLERALYRQDQASGSKRTSGQRRADALVQMALRSKAMPPGSRAPRVLISVVTGHEDFTHLCELSNGVRVAPGQVVPLLGLADIEHIAFDGHKRAITASKRRSFTGALRRAIEIRDRHCQHPCGCQIPAASCDIDHIKPYAHGGRTSQKNGRVLCSTHNRNAGLRDRAPGPNRLVLRARNRLRDLESDDDDHHQ